jgi:hypothetical protein
MNLQTLLFNTTLKTAKLYEGEREDSKILWYSNNVPTVKFKEGFYEVYYKTDEDSPQTPVARFPIASTNMFIDK